MFSARRSPCAGIMVFAIVILNTIVSTDEIRHECLHIWIDIEYTKYVLEDGIGLPSSILNVMFGDLEDTGKPIFDAFIA